MALDLNNALAQFSKSDVLGLTSDLELGSWKVLHGVQTPITLYRFAKPRVGPRINLGIREALELDGVLAISGAGQEGTVRLSGGSVCSTILKMGPMAKVVKTLNGSALQATDAVDRHSLEFSWMRDFQSSNCKVFPRVKLVGESCDFAFELDFFPAYSLGELFLDGLTNTQRSKEIVLSILNVCREDFHSRKSKIGFENYVEKVRRRLATIVQQGPSGDFFEHLYFQGARINGRKCRPLKSLLEICETSPHLASFLNCRDPRVCHGDLIPEDILYSRYYQEMKLIDPNPQISDPLADFSKMQMSFELGYDLALRDLVLVTSEISGPTLFVDFGFKDGYEAYKSLQESMQLWLPEIVDQFVPLGSTEPDRFNAHAVRLMAALQALAIPIFHLLQHKRPERSKYFFAKGHHMLELAIANAL